jgi:hypothetical protein
MIICRYLRGWMESELQNTGNGSSLSLSLSQNVADLFLINSTVAHVIICCGSFEVKKLYEGVMRRYFPNV